MFHLLKMVSTPMGGPFKGGISNCRYRKFCSEYDDSLNIYKMLIELCKNITGSGRESKEIKSRWSRRRSALSGSNLEKDLSVE